MKNIRIYMFVIVAFNLCFASEEPSNCIAGASYYLIDGVRDSRGCYGIHYFSAEGQEVSQRIEEWTKESQDLLDAKIDLQAQQVRPSFVEIGYTPQIGRVISYLNAEREVIRCGGFLPYRIYGGPVDIKNARDYAFLLKPHSLLSDVQEVREYGPLSLYLKRVITYHDDGTKTDRITPEHRLLCGAQIAMKMALIGAVTYGAYKCFTKK